jgi:hypothetical protein
VVPERLSLPWLDPAISMMKLPRFAKHLLLLVVILPLSGCVTQRTVTRGGQTVEQGLVVKRPLKEAVENSR